jgi:2,4-dienoyl-CoA reductase-like NADH-dependent reductase (Old Yellow Enzyme family)
MQLSPERLLVTPGGVGYANTPGIGSQVQIDGWRAITRAVHEASGRIFLQLWHVGRISHPIFLDGKLPVAPSAVAAKGNVSSEIAGVIEAYAQGARNAQLAGFDGVELHGA